MAGISDATIVIESGIKGGSMITAEIAVGYNREVFAVPGRIADLKSAGCCQLIRNNKAVLLTDAGELCELMGWGREAPAPSPLRKELFNDLNEFEKQIIALVDEKGTASMDEIRIRSGAAAGTVAATILALEMRHLLERLPGKLYRTMN